MGIVVFVKKRWFPFITCVEKMSKATGIAGIAGNKGGLSISFKLHRTTYCFLNCHLAAGPSQEKMKNRRTNAFDILNSIKPLDPQFDMISKFDYFFWVGDFNFRTDAFYHTVVKWSNEGVETGNFDSILEFDQLIIE